MPPPEDKGGDVGQSVCELLTSCAFHWEILPQLPCFCQYSFGNLLIPESLLVDNSTLALEAGPYYCTDGRADVRFPHGVPHPDLLGA